MNIDLAMVCIYLAITFIVGIYYSKGTKSIEMFATGGRNFSTAALAATTTATFVSGSSFIIGITYGYQDGLLKFASTLGLVLSTLFIGYIFVPRMKEFLGKLSVADVMGSLYGDNVRIITSITGLISSIGMVAIQIKILSAVFSYFGEVDAYNTAIFSAGILTLYSMFGGIRAVTFTDVVQFVTFFIVIPSIGIAICKSIAITEGGGSVDKAISHAFAFKNVSGTDYITLFFYFLIPTLEPDLVQRIVIGKTTKQVTKAFQATAIIYGIYVLIAAVIGIMLFAYNSNLETSTIFSYMIDEFTSPGVKGLVFIAVIAMAMSTADSHLNASSVLFSYDFCRPLNIVRGENNILMTSRIFTLLMGAVATFLAINFQNLISMLLFVNNFYKPVVSVPLILAILGFRSTTKAVLIGMMAGFSTVVLWKTHQYYYPGTLGFDSLIPATLANFVFFIGSHYLFAEQGGWVGPKYRGPLNVMNLEVQKQNSAISNGLREIYTAFVTPTASTLKIRTNSSMYMLFGLITVLSYFTIKVSTDTVVEARFATLHQIFTLFVGGIIFTQPLWSQGVSEKNSASVMLFAITYLLFSTAVLNFTHGFATIPVMCFAFNLLVASFFINILANIAITVFSLLGSYSYYYIMYGNPILVESYNEHKMMIYFAFALSAILLAFFRNQQQEMDFVTHHGEKLQRLNASLEQHVRKRENNLKRAMNIKSDILNNISHELRSPMHGIRNSVDLLIASMSDPKYKKYSKELAVNLKISTDRFYNYAGNILDLSQYQQGRMLFDIEKNNLKSLISDIVKSYDMHSAFKDREDYRSVKLDYSKDCLADIEIDSLKIEQVITNLINNSIQYSDECIIDVKVSNAKQTVSYDGKEWPAILIQISDQGVGIPEDELEAIFEPFTRSSRTDDKAGGKGLGLSICKDIITGHKGEIWADNNEGEGCAINILLPIQHPYNEFLGKPVANNQQPRVLVVDDEPAQLHTTANMLIPFGYEVVTAEGGMQAVNLIKSQDFDLIFLDIIMPDIDGIEVLTEVGDIITLKDIPVIIQSAVEDIEILKNTELLGARGFLTKPYSGEQLRLLAEQYAKKPDQKKVTS